MALAFSNLTASGSGTNAASYATASITPTAGAVLLVAVETDIGTAPATVPTLSGLGATWTQIADCHYDQTGTGYRLTCFRGVGASGTGAITIDYGGVTQGGCAWSVDQVIGADTSAPIVQFAKSAEPGSSGTSVTVSLAGAIQSGNGAWMCASWEAQESGSAESGWTLLGNGNHAAPAGAVCTMARADNVDQSGTISWTTSVANGGIIVEVKAYVPPTVSGKTIAGQPRIVFFGEVERSIGSVFVGDTGLHITFHNGTSLTYHNGSNIDFHLAANPEIRDVMGDLPRIVFFGDADP